MRTYTTDDAEDAVQLATLYDYDAIVTELDFPMGTERRLGELAGITLTAKLRQARVDAPIVVLQATPSVDARIRAMTAGVDYCLSKPFYGEELVVMLRRAVLRARGVPRQLLTLGNMTVDIGQKIVTIGGDRVHLTGKEYQMLELLALRRGTTITKEAFLGHLYGGMDEPEIKIVDVFICKVRARLKRAGWSGTIATIWGRGYTIGEERAAQVA